MTTTPKNADGKFPIEQQECEQYGGVWTTVPAWGIDAPDCAVHPRSRQNHLGNVAPVDGGGGGADELPQSPYYNWNVPDIATMTGLASC